MQTALKAIRAMRVLVAEADEATRADVVEGFRREGFEHVEAADRGAETLRALSAALAARAPVDLICLGLDLPDRPGLMAFEELRSVFSAAVILVAEPASAGLAKEGMARGADDYILRPLERGLLLLKAEKILTKRFLKRELRRTTARSEMLFLNVLSVMAKVLEAKDPYSRFHSENVSTLAATTAREMGLQDDEVRRIGIAGILHDLGKLGIRESILKKPGPLEPHEREIVQRHPLIASTILEPIEQLQAALSFIRHHHEHFDGSGYPEGLSGEAIPLGARIIHVAEAFDTMTSRRAYSEARSMDEALAELRRLAGVQFDPRAVEAFGAVVKRRGWITVPSDETAQQSLADVLERLTKRVSVASPTTVKVPPREDAPPAEKKDRPEGKR
jgi:response regulator RpfG family c-di-GMP phosphodiesterase